MIVIFASALIITGAVTAWFTAQAEIENVFTAGTVSIEAGRSVTMDDIIGGEYRVLQGEMGPAKVVSYQQGPRYDGTPVRAARSNPNAVLQYGLGQNETNFFSLGFGGEIIVKFDHTIIKGDGFKVIRVVEDTWGGGYPLETAAVYASKYGVEWEYLGEADNTQLSGIHTISEFDLIALDWAQFIKLVDTSNPEDFAHLYPAQKETLDGFDVNAILALNYISFDKENWNPGDCTFRRYYVTNTGTKEARVRVHFTGGWHEYDEGISDWKPWTPVPDLDVVTVTVIDGDWEDISDFWYYKGNIAGTYAGVGGVVEFQVRVCLDGPDTDNQYQGKRYILSAQFEAVQASHDASIDEWGWSP